MIRNHIKIAWRNLLKNSTYSLINIIGLTIGLAACLAVTTVVIDESSYDRFWTKKDQIFRLNSTYKLSADKQTKTTKAFEGWKIALPENFPEAEKVSGIHVFTENFKISKDNSIPVNVLETDSTAWDILDFKIIAGNPKEFQFGVENLVVSESFKNKYFPNEDIVGKELKNQPSYGVKPKSYIITGLIKDIPDNSIFKADVLHISDRREETLSKEGYGTFSQLFLLTKKGTDAKKLQEKVNKWYIEFFDSKNPYLLDFQPVYDIYLNSSFDEKNTNTSEKKLLILGSIAILLLLIACINYINLTTARASYHARNTGVRKVLGANKSHLIQQNLINSLLFFILSGCLALIIYQVSISLIENFIGHSLTKIFTKDISLISIYSLAILILGIFTGLYPAILLSGVRVTSALKNKIIKSGTHQNYIRKGLVIIQFSVSVVVIIAMIVVDRQVELLKNKDIGFNKNNLLGTQYVSWEGKGESFKNELANSPYIESVSLNAWTPGETAGNMTKSLDDPFNPGNKIEIWYLFGDADLAKTLGLELKQGRFLNSEFPGDFLNEDLQFSSDSTDIYKMANTPVLITENTAKLFPENTLNHVFKDLNAKPVGIVKNFNNESLRTAGKPIVIRAMEYDDYGSMLMRIKPGSEEKVVAKINELWQEFYPYKLLEINNVSDLLQKQYDAETKLLQFFSFFSALSLFLAALGVFGLIVQVTEQRVKEIGIRKVLGASVQSIVMLFSKDFLKTIAVAIIIAIPIGWYAMQEWLQDYAHRIEIKWWVFGLAASVVIGIAMLTVGIQSAKKAFINPAKSLKTE